MPEILPWKKPTKRDITMRKFADMEEQFLRDPANQMSMPRHINKHNRASSLYVADSSFREDGIGPNSVDGLYQQRYLTVHLNNAFSVPRIDDVLVLKLTIKDSFAFHIFGAKVAWLVYTFMGVPFTCFFIFTALIFGSLTWSYFQQQIFLFCISSTLCVLFFIIVLFSMNIVVFRYLCGQFFTWYTMGNCLLFTFCLTKVCTQEDTTFTIAESILFGVITLIFVFIDATIVEQHWSIVYGLWILGLFASIYDQLFYLKGFCEDDYFFHVTNGVNLSTRHLALAALANLCIFILKQVLVEAGDLIFYGSDFCNTIHCPIQIQYLEHSTDTLFTPESVNDEELPKRGRVRSNSVNTLKPQNRATAWQRIFHPKKRFTYYTDTDLEFMDEHSAGKLSFIGGADVSDTGTNASFWGFF